MFRPTRATVSRTPLRRQRGAALLLIVALLGIGTATMLLSIFGGPQGQALKERHTLRALEQAKEALMGYAVLNGRLPRPATSALDGRENPAPCRSEDSCTGFIPWITLGIDATDSWGKLLRYSVSPDLTQAPVLEARAVASKRVLARRDHGAVFFRAGQAACQPGSQCAAAVILSSGKNDPGTSPLGIPLPGTALSNADEVQNNIASNNFFSRATETSPVADGGEFDDLVVWVALPKLYQRMNAAGVLH